MEHHDTGLEQDAETVGVFYYIGTILGLLCCYTVLLRCFCSYEFRLLSSIIYQRHYALTTQSKQIT